ncbi:hypothetical protein GUJ93_ZPchr0002g24349 [Zizania palustris]|uniref:Uncharacterized protein n=1 Tax=Zizania palustris TaxID=103762 RepID=A0A8J5VWU5_ZIZPA|nr:hypothetical protein GUJ93_ZPchr0002g24349 [Zizania palustris]
MHLWHDTSMQAWSGRGVDLTVAWIDEGRGVRSQGMSRVRGHSQDSVMARPGCGQIQPEHGLMARGKDGGREQADNGEERPTTRRLKREPTGGKEKLTSGLRWKKTR